MTQPILVLWAVPRSRSTAFEKVMRTRGDHQCFHEPFGEPWYSGPEAKAPPQRRSAVPSSYTFDDVVRRLRGAAESGPVFIKDFPHYVLDRWDGLTDAAPLHAGMIHSFLIRDPRQQIVSMRHKWPDLLEWETGHAEQWALFERLHRELGTPPPVIDADDLVDDPDGTMAAWSAAVGIDHRPEALQWDSTDSTTEFSFYDGGSWHEQLARSTTLARQDESYSVDATHPDIADMIARATPRYAALHRHRLHRTTEEQAP